MVITRLNSDKYKYFPKYGLTTDMTTKYFGQFRGQASVRPPDIRFLNRHSPTQDLIALDFLNAAVPLQSFPKNTPF